MNILFKQKQLFSTVKQIYLDMQATTPLDYRVLDAMMPFMTNKFGNPHSRTHSYGWETEEAVEIARTSIANLINADPKEIYITSGATESNNMAIKGIAMFNPDKKHIITTQIEHKCVLDTCRWLADSGYEITYLPVNKQGLVEIDTFKSSIRKDTLCASIMYVNNEIGVIQKMKEIADICLENKIVLHTDAAQAVGKIPINVQSTPVGMLSISSHKLYGPKGIGALYIRRKPKVRILPIINGGGQERGLRSGTLAPHLIVGMGKAAEIAKYELQDDYKHVSQLFNRFKTKMESQLTEIVINGCLENRYPGNINMSFSCVEGESLIMSIKDCAVSSGSACTSASLEPSYVLRALGVDEEMAHTSIRIGIGRFTLESEIDQLAASLVKSVNRLRDMSPLWEMKQNGIDLKEIQWSQPH